MAASNTVVKSSVVKKQRPKPPAAGKGRVKGTPNKATADARKAIAEFVDGNAHRLTEWLDRVAIDKPEKAFELFQSVVEYHVPKLARTEVVGDANSPLVISNITRQIVKPEE